MAICRSFECSSATSNLPLGKHHQVWMKLVKIKLWKASQPASLCVCVFGAKKTDPHHAITDRVVKVKWHGKVQQKPSFTFSDAMIWRTVLNGIAVMMPTLFGDIYTDNDTHPEVLMRQQSRSPTPKTYTTHTHSTEELTMDAIKYTTTTTWKLYQFTHCSGAAAAAAVLLFLLFSFYRI